MKYYTLTEQGRSDSPSKHIKTYSALIRLLRENDLPRTSDQIIKEGGTEEGIRWLEEQGYVSPSKLPKPEASARQRVPTIEALAESEVKREASQRRYMHGESGKRALERYWTSEKGKKVRSEYWKSDKGKTAQRRWRLKRRISEMEEHMSRGLGNKVEIMRAIEKAKKELDLLSS